MGLLHGKIWQLLYISGPLPISARSTGETALGGKPGSMFNISPLSGKRFGKLVVGNRVANVGTHAVWQCLCDCGVWCEVKGSRLKTGRTVSCGCYRLEQLRKAITKHGKAGTVEHQTWKRLRGRCLNPQSPDYHHYGGRGIKVCERWLESFENFYADMGDRPTSEHSIDRIDVNGDYSPENCRWATPQQQAANRRKTHVDFDGLSLTVAEWSARLEVPQGRIYRLLKSDRNTQQAFQEWTNAKLARTR